ncbi:MULTISPECIES: CcmD family protein [Pedobacter]|uniref:CcmD family protein n=1 Tax=Pedobacter TaxID=84567 RepID=UPI002109C5E1|nr:MULTISPECIES: CcmD family protein [unclassified Pedobacter]
MINNLCFTLSESVYASGKIYVVVACIVLILAGLLLYLFSIEKRLKKIERNSSLKS